MFRGFEHLAQSAGKLWWCKMTQKKWLNVQLYHTPAPKMLKISRIMNPSLLNFYNKTCSFFLTNSMSMHT